MKADVLESKKHILERKDDDEKVLSVIRRNIFKSYTYENNRNKQIVVSPKLVDTLIQDYDVKVFLKLLDKITEKNYESKKLLFKQYLYKIFEEESVLTKELDKEHKNIKSELTLMSNEMSTNNLYSMMSDNINKDLKNLNKIAIEQIRKIVHVMPDFIEDYKLAYFMFNKMMEDIIESKREKLFLLLEISERLFRNSNDYGYVNNHGYKEYFRESMKKLLSKNNDHYIREEINAHIYSNSIEDKVKAFSLNVLLKHAGLESFDFTEYARECLERHKREGVKDVREIITKSDDLSFLFKKEINKSVYEDKSFEDIKSLIMRELRALAAAYAREEVLGGTRISGASVSNDNTCVMRVNKNINDLLSKNINQYNSKNQEISYENAKDGVWSISFPTHVDLSMLNNKELDVLLVSVTEYLDGVVLSKNGEVSPVAKYREIILSKKLEEADNNNSIKISTGKKKI